jgi:hypothetical protein
MSSTLLDEPASRQSTMSAQRLRSTMAAVRVSMSWFGTRKTLTPEQRAEAAEPFGTDARFLSAGKRLLDISHPAYKAVTAAKTTIRNYWIDHTLPYPEDGVRLLRQSDVASFTARMEDLRMRLHGTVIGLENAYQALREKARRDRGSLFREADYPATLVGLFDAAWEFPSLAPPEWLLTRNPELYQQQAARIAARFDEAARMAEDAFLAELAGLVQTLQDKLAGKADGVAKRLHDTNVSDLREFFEKFRRLNIHSSEQLDGIVEQAEKAVTLNGLFDLGGVSADQLRESPSLRQAVSTRLSAVGAQLDGLMVDRPRRAINRRPKASDGEQE